MKTFNSEEELERVFDLGEESILDYADMSTINKPNRTTSQRISLNLSDSTVARLDDFAARYGTTRQNLIRVWLTERMDEEDGPTARHSHATA